MYQLLSLPFWQPFDFGIFFDIKNLGYCVLTPLKHKALTGNGPSLEMDQVMLQDLRRRRIRMMHLLWANLLKSALTKFGIRGKSFQAKTLTFTDRISLVIRCINHPTANSPIWVGTSTTPNPKQKEAQTI